jgi:hypothetical protein
MPDIHVMNTHSPHSHYLGINWNKRSDNSSDRLITTERTSLALRKLQSPDRTEPRSRSPESMTTNSAIARLNWSIF